MATPEFRLGLFARTFLLLALLMLASLGAWLHVFFTLDLKPRTERTISQIVQTAELSRIAMAAADATQASTVLAAINRQKDTTLQPVTGAEQITALPEDAYWQAIHARLKTELGPEVALAAAINGQPATWVLVQWPQGPFWLGLDIDKTNLTTAPEWVSWVAAAALLSLLGAAVAVGYMNRPLARLARAAQRVSRGEKPDPLPETGAVEIRELNASFNRMVFELQQAETDRNLMLAGISHDLRTPLARMRLEVEMSPMSEAQRRDIDQDLSQVDRTIGQLLEYARPARELPAHPINLTEVVQDVIAQFRDRSGPSKAIMDCRVRAAAYGLIDRQDFSRCLINLIENARRYGTQGKEPAQIEIVVQARRHLLQIDVRDRGPGIPSKDIARVMRPFSRGEAARTGSSGSGLGLSIVDRLLSRAGGRLRLLSREGGGLIARMDLPRAKRPTQSASPIKKRQPPHKSRS
jgi:two-component system osmolarity sensor histidine kinase EnvZ